MGKREGLASPFVPLFLSFLSYPSLQFLQVWTEEEDDRDGGGFRDGQSSVVLCWFSLPSIAAHLQMLAGPFTRDLCGFFRVLRGNLFTPPVSDKSDALWPLTTPLSYHYQHILGIPLLLQAGAFWGDLRPVAFCGGHLAQGKLCTCRCSSHCPLPSTCHWGCSGWSPAHFHLAHFTLKLLGTQIKLSCDLLPTLLYWRWSESMGFCSSASIWQGNEVSVSLPADNSTLC